MKLVKKYKVAIIFYLVMLIFTFIVSARVEKLESKEDIYKYTSEVAINTLN